MKKAGLIVDDEVLETLKGLSKRSFVYVPFEKGTSLVIPDTGDEKYIARKITIAKAIVEKERIAQYGK